MHDTKNGETACTYFCPSYQYAGYRGLLLNLRLDVEMDGMTYYMTGELSEKPELGDVLDTVELERSQRQSA